MSSCLALPLGQKNILQPRVLSLGLIDLLVGKIVSNAHKLLDLIGRLACTQWTCQELIIIKIKINNKPTFDEKCQGFAAHIKHWPNVKVVGGLKQGIMSICFYFYFYFLYFYLTPNQGQIVQRGQVAVNLGKLRVKAVQLLGLPFLSLILGHHSIVLKNNIRKQKKNKYIPTYHVMLAEFQDLIKTNN